MFNVMEANTDGAGCTVMESEKARFQRSAGVRERGMYREKRWRTWETPSGSISYVPVWVCVYNNKEGMQTTDGESDIFIVLRGRVSRLHVLHKLQLCKAWGRDVLRYAACTGTNPLRVCCKSTQKRVTSPE